jgi:DNA adenine methylase
MHRVSLDPVPRRTNPESPPQPVSKKTASPARPFLKWAGGKRRLAPILRTHVPEWFGCYFEPFLGGGALFFDRKPDRAVLGDRNERLVRTYRAVRDQVEEVIRLLSSWPHDKAFFHELRERDIDVQSDVDVAAWMIYLNKTAFNGLYRVNSHNRFNVPFGKYENPTICDAENLRACARTLEDVGLCHDDFLFVLDVAHEGDFVYFDPPYVPLSATSSFTNYTHEGFGPQDQIRLRDCALTLKQRGVSVLLSNSSAPFVRELYADGFEREEVMAARNINRNAGGRKKIAELLFW